MENWSRLVPELVVLDIKKSVEFWCQLIGFNLVYERVEDGFVYLDLNGAQIMLEQHNRLDREWETAPLEAPFGRGINFQIEVDDIHVILDRLKNANYPLFVPLEEKWYRADELEFGQLQFLVTDPDGYLLRLNEVLGERRI
jgi:catechol 2,3-dioxygenase-like lactoylglutathione lyase family enzyme